MSEHVLRNKVHNLKVLKGLLPDGGSVVCGLAVSEIGHVQEFPKIRTYNLVRLPDVAYRAWAVAKV